MSHFVAYILQFQEIIVYKIPPGGGRGVYSQPKVYKYVRLKNIAYIHFYAFFRKQTNDQSNKTSLGNKRISG